MTSLDEQLRELFQSAESPVDDLPGEVGLVLGRIDVRVAVVLERAEEPVEPDVDARRLDHRGLEGLEGDPAGVELGQDVAVAQQHSGTLCQ